MICPNCGSTNRDGDKFCTSCGSPLNNEQQQQQQQQQQPPQQTETSFNGQNFNQNPENPGNPGNSVKNRNLATCIILSLVTCGIYSIYWMICMVDDLNRLAGKPDDKNGVTVFLLSLITCGIYGYVWYYGAGEKYNRLQTQNGSPAGSSSGVMFLLLALFGLQIVDMAIIQSELNKAAV